MTRLLRYAAFLAAVFMSTAAFAATALVTTPLNLRTGPGTGYPIVTSMPDGAMVNVPGCARGYNWCRVDWNGYRGWASASYLAFRSGNYRHRAFSRYGAEIGVPLIAGIVIGQALHGSRHYRHHHYRPERPRYRHHDWHHGRGWHQGRRDHDNRGHVRRHHAGPRHHGRHVRRPVPQVQGRDYRPRAGCRNSPRAAICR